MLSLIQPKLVLLCVFQGDEDKKDTKSVDRRQRVNSHNNYYTSDLEFTPYCLSVFSLHVLSKCTLL